MGFDQGDEELYVAPTSAGVAQIEFAEWTADGHLRHSNFVGLREDKNDRDVVREVES